MVATLSAGVTDKCSGSGDFSVSYIKAPPCPMKYQLQFLSFPNLPFIFNPSS